MADNKWKRPEAGESPLYIGKEERDLVKQVSDEIFENVAGQTIVYYAISLEHTNFNKLYGEAINKTFLPPIRVFAGVKWEGYKTFVNNYGIDRRSSLSVYFHKRRLAEDQDLYVREGDFILYGDQFYEITDLNEPKQMFGQISNRYEIEAKAIKARSGLFNAK